MAHASMIVEQAVRYFLHQWHCGLQPSLSLKTLSNGVVYASSAVHSLPKFDQNNLNDSFHRSGHSSQSRRRHKRRNQASKIVEPSTSKTDDIQNNSFHTNSTSIDQTITTSPSSITSNSTTFNQLSSEVVKSIETQTDYLDLSYRPETHCAGTLSLPNQIPINCIRHEDGCDNMISSYFNKYTAICKSCSKFLAEKLKSTPYSHFLCPCCHEPNSGEPLSFCAECIGDLYQDGWIETGRGSWHLDRDKNEIVCISLDFHY